MSSRAIKFFALAVPPLVWGVFAGCTATTSIKSTGSQGAGDDGGANLGYDGGVAVIGDSGVVQDDAPSGCPGWTQPSSVSAPAGQMLVAGNSLSTRGVTSDGYEIFSDDYASQLYAVPVGGGPAQSIAALGDEFWVTVVGQVVFAWSGVSAQDVGALTIWTSAHGPVSIASSSFGILGASSTDGTQVLYVGNVDAQGQTGDVVLVGTDGSGSKTLLQGQQLSGCFPQLGFAGTHAVVSHCDTPRGQGPSATISSFVGPGWSRVDLVTSAENTWSADTAGSFVLASTGGGIMTIPVAGGSAKTLDSSGFMGVLISGGQTAIYGTTSGALRRSPTSSPSPVTLSSPFGGFYGVSPSQNSVMFYQNQATGGATDLFLSSTSTPGNPQVLSSSTTASIGGDTFTADSNYALYSTGDDVCTGAAVFSAFPVNGGSAIPLGKNVWGDWAATGSKVVFNDNFVATGGLRYGRADIESVDAAGGSPTLVVGQADAVLDLSPAHDKIIYSWTVQPGPQAGIYAVSVP